METGRPGPWILTVERGPSAGAGGRRRGQVRFCPFWRSSSGRCPLPPLGPEGGDPATAALLRRPPPLPVRCRRIAAATGGWASSREGRAGSPPGERSPAAVLAARRGALMDLTACVSATVCSLQRRRRRPGPARPVRPPRASEVRVPGPESGGGEGEGAGEGRGGGGAITPSPPPAGSTRAPCGARTTPASRACPRRRLLLLLSPAAAPFRPSTRPQAGAARPQAGGGCQAARPRALPSSGRRRAERGARAEGTPRRGARRPPGRAVLGRAVPGRAAAARGGRRRARGRRWARRAARSPQGEREPAAGARPGVQTGDGWCGGGSSSLAPGSLSGLTPANMQNYRPGRS